MAKISRRSALFGGIASALAALTGVRSVAAELADTEAMPSWWEALTPEEHARAVQDVRAAAYWLDSLADEAKRANDEATYELACQAGSIVTTEYHILRFALEARW